MLNDLSHSLKVTLIAVHYYMLVPSVIFMGQLLAAGFDGGLHKGLLRVNVEHAVSLLRKLADGGDPLSERFKYLQVVL